MKNEKIGEFLFNAESRRWCLVYTDDIEELHCGDCFQIELKGNKWEQVRIEMGSDNWYLVTSLGNLYIPKYPCRVKGIQ